MVLRSAEDSRKRRWRRKQLQHCFFEVLFKTAKEVITPKVKSESKVQKSVLNEFIQKIASGPDRTVPLGNLYGLYDISMNIGKFNSGTFKNSELSQIVKKKRNASQPSPKHILYKVYKKCPKIMNYILRIMFIAVGDKVIPLNLSVSGRIMISKVQNPRESNLADCRQIALGNAEGKLFWSLIGQKLYQLLVTTGL